MVQSLIRSQCDSPTQMIYSKMSRILSQNPLLYNKKLALYTKKDISGGILRKLWKDAESQCLNSGTRRLRCSDRDIRTSPSTWSIPTSSSPCPPPSSMSACCWVISNHCSISKLSVLSAMITNMTWWWLKMTDTLIFETPVFITGHIILWKALVAKGMLCKT